MEKKKDVVLEDEKAEQVSGGVVVAPGPDDEPEQEGGATGSW